MVDRVSKSYKLIVEVIVGLLLAVLGFLYASQDHRLSVAEADIRANKADADGHYEAIDQKLDNIWRMIYDHDRGKL